MSSEPTETCMFFVDDSNIWIEAQKFAALGNNHMPKLTDSDRDPRLRIDIGKLIDTLRNGRNQGPSFLYGSRPPPNDTVWKAFEKFKFKTKIYDRARGKEKEVDNSMATDLSSKATELKIRAEYDLRYKQQKANTTFVAITGDRDILPPIKKVLESDIRVELWAWQSGISTEYLKLNSENGLFSVHFMNRIFDKISFTNFRSTRQSKTNQVDPCQTIVLCDFADLCGDNLESSVREQLILLGRLFYITLSKTETEMFVEFPKVKNIETMVLEARELFKEMLTVLSWPEYASRFNEDLPAMVETSNIYAPLIGDNGQYSADVAAKEEHEPVKCKAKLSSTAEPGGGHRENGSNDPDDNNGWETVARSDLGKDHRRGIRQTQQCSDRIRCRKRGECGYRHSDEERNLFQDYPDLDFGRWKTKKCNRAHSHQGKRCSYAHTRDEAWCLRCHHNGHYTEECRYRS
ncbi:NYN domain-containing protein [Cladophialophora immunda]|nr:NYN domain-containing protein [Cladophialophora immunda]